MRSSSRGYPATDKAEWDSPPVMQPDLIDSAAGRPRYTLTSTSGHIGCFGLGRGRSRKTRGLQITQMPLISPGGAFPCHPQRPCSQ